MKLAFSTLGCPDWPLDTVIARARDYGFDGVDFRGCAGQLDIWNLPEFSTRIAETAAKLKHARLAVPAISSSARLLTDTDEDRAKSMDNLAASARVAHELGATFVRVFGGHNGARPYPDALNEAAAALDAMARNAAHHGVTVLLETHDDWIASDKVRELLDTAAEPNVGVIWDINHPWAAAGESPEQTWANLAPCVRYIHVKDTCTRPDGKRGPCLLGQGELPLPEILALLRRERYAGWYTLEWEKKWHPEIPDPEIAFPHYINFMRNFAQ